MKKFLFSFLFITLLTTFLAPQLVSAGLVPCGNEGGTPCTIAHFFVLIQNVFNFIVLAIATPLAGLMIVIGGVLILLSGVNAKWYDTGKSIIKISIIALLLIWGSVLIINTLFAAIGYQYPWNFNPF